MRMIVVVVVASVALTAPLVARQPASSAGGPGASHLQVILLGSVGGPAPNPQQFGISTLVVAGSEKVLFDCGRAATIRMAHMGMLLGELTSCSSRICIQITSLAFLTSI